MGPWSRDRPRLKNMNRVRSNGETNILLSLLYTMRIDGKKLIAAHFFYGAAAQYTFPAERKTVAKLFLNSLAACSCSGTKVNRRIFFSFLHQSPPACCLVAKKMVKSLREWIFAWKFHRGPLCRACTARSCTQC